MVKRKPVNAGTSRTSNSVPYPVTPIVTKEPIAEAFGPALRPISGEGSQTPSAGLPSSTSTSGMANSTIAWANGDTATTNTNNGLPPTLKAGDGIPSTVEAHRGADLPSSLQAGPIDNTPRSSFESQNSAERNTSREQFRGPDQATLGSSVQSHNSNNPFLRMRDDHGIQPNVSNVDDGSSAGIWGETAGEPTSKNSEAQASSVIMDTEASDLSGGLSERSPFAEPWVDLQPSHTGVPIPSLAAQRTTIEQDYSDVVDNPFSAYGSVKYQASGSNHDPHGLKKGVYDLPTSQKSETSTDIAKRLPAIPFNDEERRPELPPRGSREIPNASQSMFQESEVESFSAQPNSLVPNRTISGSGGSQLSEVEKQQNRVKKQRSETYQIRLVNWFDASCSTNPRRSPIMVQNANGPCPLLALVNALVLSTPAGIDTALVETLRIREQVSLGLLLDAVIDELMSGRRGDAAQELPDVSDLYAFLITLHTGMNVNPRFVMSEMEIPSLMDAPVSELPMSPLEAQKPGGFEDTREMRLYSTFAIPLIHGWLPPKNHPAFAALQRSAKTYEDAQNLMFMEEELEDKLQQEGLGPQEQLLLEDIASVKFFLSSSATQLTGYGLDTMTDALPPGSIAILFRNDHFSTLYKHPRSDQLFTLVTDMGYAGHDEVVWESLVDISGEGCEFFAGDFRSVGHNTGKQLSQSNSMGMSDDSGWTTVSRNNNRSCQTLPSGEASAQSTVDSSNILPPLSSLSLDKANEKPVSPNTEQEDHDLALALQLQEEEEDRERRETAARRREDELSQAYLEAQGPSARRGPVRASEVRPVVPPRGGGAAKQSDTREDAPPPTYEQAAKVPAYHPPEDDPLALPNRPGNSARPQGTRQRQSSAYSQNAAAFAGSPSVHNANFAGPPPMRGNPRRRSSARGGMVGGFEGAPGSGRRNGYQGARVVSEEEDKRDCIIM